MCMVENTSHCSTNNPEKEIRYKGYPSPARFSDKYCIDNIVSSKHYRISSIFLVAPVSHIYYLLYIIKY